MDDSKSRELTYPNEKLSRKNNTTIRSATTRVIQKEEKNDFGISTPLTIIFFISVNGYKVLIESILL